MHTLKVLMVVLLFTQAWACSEGQDASGESEVAGAVSLPAAVAEKERGMASDAEKLAVAQEMLDAWTRLDWERVYDLFGEDGVLHNMMLEPTVGAATIRERFQAFEQGLTRMDFIVQRMGVLDGEVVIERIDSFDFNGVSGEVPVVGIMRIEDGRVKEWREYYDRAQLLAAMGVSDGS